MRMERPLEVRAWFNPARDKAEVYVRHFDRGGSRLFVGQPLELREMAPGECPSEPTFLLDREAAQGLADSLWEAGFKPAGAAGSAGQAEAMKQHIADLRMLVAQLMNRVPLPEERK